MVENILKALRVFDEREATIGRAWLTMNNLKKYIFNDETFLLTSQHALP
jgi:hypothetical protein